MLDVQNETAVMQTAPVPQPWTRDAALALYQLPFNDLLFRAQTVHRQHFDPNRVQLSKLLNIKTGGCPEDCGYCSQSSHHSTGLAASKLMDVDGCGRRGAQGQGRRRDAVLHGRGLAQSEAARHGCHRRDGGRGQGARARDLHDARHARARPGRAAERSRSRLLQPQHRYLRGLLSERHLDQDVCRSAADAGPRASVRHEGLLRRHPRHGRKRG